MKTLWVIAICFNAVKIHIHFALALLRKHSRPERVKVKEQLFKKWNVDNVLSGHQKQSTKHNFQCYHIILQNSWKKIMWFSHAHISMWKTFTSFIACIFLMFLNKWCFAVVDLYLSIWTQCSLETQMFEKILIKSFI